MSTRFAMSEPTPIGKLILPIVQSFAYTDERVEWARDRRGAQRKPIPRLMRDAILQRDDYACQWCFVSTRRRALIAIDHIVPWSGGGADHPVNLRALCDDCNQKRSNRVTDIHTARALAISWRCMRCALPRGNGTAVPAYCMTCRGPGSSPFLLLGGRIPTVGVPPAAIADLEAAESVEGELERFIATRQQARMTARRELDAIRCGSGS